MLFYRVCFLSELSTEKPLKYVVDDLELLLVKSLHHNKVYAFSYYCTHEDKSLEKGKWDQEKEEITCPFHKAVFSLLEGGIVKAPPACVKLPMYLVDIRIENSKSVVYVEV